MIVSFFTSMDTKHTAERPTTLRPFYFKVCAAPNLLIKFRSFGIISPDWRAKFKLKSLLKWYT
jgi:hypothetical protein